MVNRRTQVQIPEEVIMTKIILLRNQKVMMDKDLAEMYGVNTKRLNEQVRRNSRRFPSDFMFQVTQGEKEDIIRHFPHLRSIKYSNVLPNVFTEHGAVMLASVLNSHQAIEVNIQIVKAFTKTRRMLLDTHDIRLDLEKLRKKVEGQGKSIEIVFDYLDQWLQKKGKPEKRRMIGFKIPKRRK